MIERIFSVGLAAAMLDITFGNRFFRKGGISDARDSFNQKFISGERLMGESKGRKTSSMPQLDSHSDAKDTYTNKDGVFSRGDVSHLIDGDYAIVGYDPYS